MDIGNVSHDKSTLTRILSNISTGKFKEEKKRNMTIKLGYANFKIWGCDCKDELDIYKTTSSNIMTGSLCKYCSKNAKLLKHISIVDSPGHADLIGTMLSGASVMDNALLVISAKEDCPSPQTIEHLISAEEYGLSEKLIIIQNKIDLCSL